MISPERRAALTAKAQGFADNVKQGEAYLLSRGISLQVGEMFGLGFVPYGHEFGGRISIPYNTPAGVVAIKYRKTDEDDPGPKYMNETGLGVHLYNAQALIRAEGRVCVTEGEFDTIAIQAYCGIPAVAYPGTDTWKRVQHWRYCFEDIPEVIVIADGDEVGHKAAVQVAESIGHASRVVRMPEDAKDSNSFIVKYGAEAFIHKLNS